MGGNVRVYSDGIGHGTSFIITMSAGSKVWISELSAEI